MHHRTTRTTRTTATARTSRPNRAVHVAAAALAATAVLAPAAPAAAGSSSQSRARGTTASATWIEYGTLPGGAVAGNAHVGDIFVDGGTRIPRVFGQVTDWTCPEGVRPPAGGGGPHQEEPPPPEETPCTLESVRFIQGTDDLVFSVDRRLSRGRLVGTLAVSDHGGGAPAQPPVDMTWTGVGTTSTERTTSTYSDGTYTYTFRYEFTGRQATVDGRIGPMLFSDDADDESTGALGTYRAMERSRSR